MVPCILLPVLSSSSKHRRHTDNFSALCRWIFRYKTNLVHVKSALTEADFINRFLFSYSCRHQPFHSPIVRRMCILPTPLPSALSLAHVLLINICMFRILYFRSRRMNFDMCVCACVCVSQVAFCRLLVNLAARPLSKVRQVCQRDSACRLFIGKRRRICFVNFFDHANISRNPSTCLRNATDAFRVTLPDVQRFSLGALLRD